MPRGSSQHVYQRPKYETYFFVSVLKVFHVSASVFTFVCFYSMAECELNLRSIVDCGFRFLTCAKNFLT